MRRMRILAILALAVLISGCSGPVKEEVKPINSFYLEPNDDWVEVYGDNEKTAEVYTVCVMMEKIRQNNIRINVLTNRINRLESDSSQ